MRNCLSVSIIIFVTFTLSVSTVNAILITSNILDNPTVIDFSEFANNQQGPFEGPVQIGYSVGSDVTITGKPFDGTDGAYLRNSHWGLWDNGLWDDGRNGFAAYGWGKPPGTMIFSFNDSPVSVVGAYMNDAPGFTDFFISAYDSEMNLIESHDIWHKAPIKTPGMDNVGAFRGIALESSLISHFGITGFVPAADDLAFTTTPIPEPATIFLLMTGLAGTVGVGRKKNI